MPYKPAEIESMLETKLKMSIENEDHRWFVLQFEGLPLIRTKISHSKKEIGDMLENRIAKQLRVRTKFFRELMDCTKQRNEYQVQITDDPFPPFEQWLV